MQLTKVATEIRKDIIQMIYNVKSGNPGSALSGVEFIAYLYFEELKINPAEPEWQERDRFILSKGQAAPALYSAMAHRGFFDRNELVSFRKFESRLQTHPERKKLPGIDFSSGSLGQGLSAAIGMSLGMKRKQINDSRIFVYLGDGEIQEGQVWEAAMAASHFQLDNIYAFVDCNEFQGDASIAETMNIEPLTEKWKSFGWEVRTVDGHDFVELRNAVKELQLVKNKPKVLVARTVKGKGISFMEKNNKWHLAGHMTELDFRNAMDELEGRMA